MPGLLGRGSTPLDSSAATDEKAKAIAAKQFKTKEESKQRELTAPRLDFREYVGSSIVREATLKPLP